MESQSYHHRSLRLPSSSVHLPSVCFPLAQSSGDKPEVRLSVVMGPDPANAGDLLRSCRETLPQDHGKGVCCVQVKGCEPCVCDIMNMCAVAVVSV